jgi:hypothetical protein
MFKRKAIAMPELPKPNPQGSELDLKVQGKISEEALNHLKETLLLEIMKDAFQDSKDKFEYYQGQAVGVNRIIQKLIVRS